MFRFGNKIKYTISSFKAKWIIQLIYIQTWYEIVEILKEHTAAEVVRILDKLERKYTEKGFRQLFKTITVDNETEFADFDGLKQSQSNKKDTGMDEQLPPEWFLMEKVPLKRFAENQKRHSYIKHRSE